jgi:hypothetical protein|tara:strand:+ start:950 stop:1261 length:312 start_codon:yes stop_codon:yes gene_type:complete
MPTDKEKDKIFDILDDFQSYGDYNDSYRKLAAAFRKSGTGIMRPRPSKRRPVTRGKTTRKPSKYNLFFKKLTKQPKYKKMNNTRRLKAIGVAWRKTPAGRKKK